MIKLEVDGKTVEVENGATVMEAANKLGIFVPHFCYHKKLSIAAAEAAACLRHAGNRRHESNDRL
jgi:NADH dehydrogenase/NADH:ubiquinone oxidoreductase subunit G